MMNIIKNNKIDLQTLKNSIVKPEIYEKSTAKFWDDEHISKQMLKLHLNPEVESASKTKETILAETSLIIQRTKMDSNKTVLDLGCGPGLYVEQFAKTGAKVTGVDLSGRSINYANDNIKPFYKNVQFMQMNYLDINFKASFDIVTLIFYDFCVLSEHDQKRLLAKIHASLKEDGVFIFDVLTENRKTPLSDSNTSISICEGGFWSPDPYIEILNIYMYDAPRTEGMQYTIIDEHGAVKLIRLYQRLFALDEITKMLNEHHFKVEKVYKNLKGDALSEDSETYGIFARKA